MKIFKDVNGKTWEISLNLDTVLAVRDEMGVDLLQPELGTPPLLTRIGTDEVVLGEIILCLIKEQMEAAEITAKQVRQAFGGSTLLQAQTAFYEEMIDFFQGRGHRHRAKMVQKQLIVIEKAIQAIVDKVDDLDLDEMVDGAMSGSLQEQSESTPAD